MRSSLLAVALVTSSAAHAEPAPAEPAPAEPAPAETPARSFVRCGLGAYLDSQLFVGGVRDGVVVGMHNALGVRWGGGCARGRAISARAGLYLDAQLGGALEGRGDAAGLELEVGAETPIGELGGRFAVGIGDAGGPIYVGGVRLRRGPLVFGGDVFYLSRDRSNRIPAIAGASVTLGLQGRAALAGLLLFVVVVAANFNPSS